MTTCTTKDSMATDTASVGANGWLAETKRRTDQCVVLAENVCIYARLSSVK